MENIKPVGEPGATGFIFIVRFYNASSIRLKFDIVDVM